MLSLFQNGFNPASIAGLALWLQIESLAGLANDDPVSTWPDSSGNGRHAIGVTTGRPLYKASPRGVLFDGINDRLDTSAFTQAQPNTIFIATSHAAGATGSMIYINGISSRQQLWMQLSPPQQQAYAGGSLIAGAATVGTFLRVISCIFNGASTNIRENGISKVTADAGANALSGGAIFGTDTFGNWLSGYLYEVLIYSGALSDANRQSVEGYLATKYQG